MEPGWASVSVVKFILLGFMATALGDFQLEVTTFALLYKVTTNTRSG